MSGADWSANQALDRPTGATPEERLARVALNAIGEPGDPRLARLVAAMGAQEVHERLRSDIDLAGIRSEVAERLAATDPERILAEAADLGIRFLVPGDAEWPAGMSDLATVEPLNQLSGEPLGLWVKGPLRLAATCRSAVAVVGSRSATTYGTGIARDLAAHLAENEVAVVSGAAFGIDQAAHRGALAVSGATLAVLACGVDRAYPVAHRGLLEHLAEVGAVVSELRPGCAPTRVRFLSRNRLIAALTTGTVVVEAAIRSGALNTANWAGRLNRTLMGVPGPVTSAPSEGVHELIREGRASLVTRGEHVLELVSPAGKHLHPVPRVEATPRDLLELTEQRVLEAVPLVRPAAAVAIARTAGLATATVRVTLHRLEELGWVVREADEWRRPAPAR